MGIERGQRTEWERRERGTNLRGTTMSEKCVSCFGIKDEEGVSVQGRQEGTQQLSCDLWASRNPRSGLCIPRFPLPS